MGWLQETLDTLQDLGPRGGLDRFAESLDPEWIVEALTVTGTGASNLGVMPLRIRAISSPHLRFVTFS